MVHMGDTMYDGKDKGNIARVGLGLNNWLGSVDSVVDVLS
jgi:hypothetical protein